MTDSIWKPIGQAEKGAGQQLLRVGPGVLDGVFIGYMADDGRWLDQENREVRPTWFAPIPAFDGELEGADGG